MDNYVEYGVLSSDGSKCVNKSKKNKMIHYSHNQEGSILYAGVSAVSKLLKISEEEKVALDNDYDPIAAPPGPYIIQPSNQGQR